MSEPAPSGEANLYAPPKAEVRTIRVPEASEFYVVASYKFFLLFFLTLGIYQIYWFYRHWQHFRRWHDHALWPIPRAIFAIFFTHSLAGEIDHRLRKAASEFRWSPNLIAIPYVVTQIAAGILDRLAWRGIGFPVTDWLSIAMLLPLAFFGHAMQRAANAACGDPAGKGNARLTVANWVWIVLGVLFWLLAMLGLLVPEEMAPVDVDLPA